MNKRIFYDDEARQRLLAGAEILYNAVKTTLGPKGRNVVIQKNYGPPTVTHDGVTVARAVEIAVKEETLGYKAGIDLLRAASLKLETLAGDGTTTVVVLTYHLLKEANKLIAAGHSPINLRKELEKAAEEVLKALKGLSEDITENSKKVAQIGSISAGDKEIGELIAKIMKEIGKDGIVTVEEGQGIKLESEVVKGYTFDRGFISPYLVTDATRMEAISERPLILITDAKIRSIQEILPLIEQLVQAQKKDFVIIADDVEGDALQTIVMNKVKGTFNAVAIKAPSFGDQRKEILNDIAILTGGKFISEDQGYSLATTTMDMLGQARRIVVSQNETTIIEGVGASEDVETRIQQIHKQAENAKTPYDKERFDNRAAALSNSVAIIHVGGVTETEIEEKKFRVDDAVHAVKAALDEGIVNGGGITLMHLTNAVNASTQGGMLLRNALEMPFKILMSNSGLVAEYYYHNIEATKDKGVDVRSGQLVNLKEAGIVDPTRVTKEVIQNAVSIAGTAITMGSLMVDEPEENDTPLPPQMPMRP